MTNRSKQDVELISKYLAGDHGAFDELMQAHENRVFGICLRVLRNREAALDVTQETFLTVFRKADRYQATAAFSTWLYRVTMNACYDYLRRSKRQVTHAVPEGLDPADQGSSDSLVAAELRPDIESALAKISTEFQATIILVDLNGLGVNETAEILGIPIGTVKSRLYRGRRQLGLILRNLGDQQKHQTDEVTTFGSESG